MSASNQRHSGGATSQAAPGIELRGANLAVAGSVATAVASVLSIAALQGVTPAAAADAGAEAPAAAKLEEIVVTAQKRQQAVADVPLSIQAFDGDALAQASERDFSEVINSVPGASEELSNTIGQRRYQIRGVAQALGGDSTVGYYFDDAAFFFYGQGFAPQGRTFDMNRVEILRGPQGTLYGNSAMGGVVRFIPNAPNLSAYEGQVQAGYTTTDGGDPSYYVDGAVSMPLVDGKLGLRLVGSTEDVGGYVETVYPSKKNVNDGKIKNWRASVLYQPTDELDIKFMYMHNEADQTGGTLLRQLDPPIATGTPDDYSDNQYDLYSVTIDYDFGAAALTSNSTWIDYQQAGLYVFPFPGAPNDQLRLNVSADSQAFNNETRLVSQGDGPMQWMLGVFYSDSDLKGPQSSNMPALIPSTNQALKSQAISVFSEVSWKFLDGRLIPLVGLRYFEDDRSSRTDLVGVGTIDSGKATFDSVGPRFNLSWIPSGSALWYLNVAKGFRSGSFNNAALCNLNPACKTAVDSDELWNYEIGTKHTFAGDQLFLDSAAYYQDWKDVREGVPFYGVYQAIQVGDAEIYGLDLALAYRPSGIAGLTFELSGNWNQAEFTRLDPVVEALTGAQVGDRLPFVPKWTLTASVSDEMPVAGAWKLEAYLGFTHLEPQSGQFGSTAIGDSRDLLRARIGLTNGPIGAYLFGNNLLDENGAIYAQNPTGGVVAYTQDYPRQIGAEFRYSYR